MPTADNQALRYKLEAAYPFHLLHQTVSIGIAFFQVQWNADPLLKFSVVAVSSLVATIGLYDVLVRRTNATRFLFGMKPKPRIALRQLASS